MIYRGRHNVTVTSNARTLFGRRLSVCIKSEGWYQLRILVTDIPFSNEPLTFCQYYSFFGRSRLIASGADFLNVHTTYFFSDRRCVSILTSCSTWKFRIGRRLVAGNVGLTQNRPTSTPLY